MQDKSQDSPVNIQKIKQSNLKNYIRVKAGENFQENDLIHLIDEDYVKLSNGSQLLKNKVNQHNIVYRKR